MVKVAVISGTHGVTLGIDKICESMYDYVLFLGDGHRDTDRLESEFGPKFIKITGNCDMVLDKVEYTIVRVNEYFSIFATHGHLYRVKGGLESLALNAKAKNCNIALYGHTHKYNVENVEGVTCINPGNGNSYDASFIELIFDGKDYKINKKEF